MFYVQGLLSESDNDDELDEGGNQSTERDTSPKPTKRKSNLFFVSPSTGHNKGKLLETVEDLGTPPKRAKSRSNPSFEKVSKL